MTDTVPNGDAAISHWYFDDQNDEHVMVFCLHCVGLHDCRSTQTGNVVSWRLTELATVKSLHLFEIAAEVGEMLKEPGKTRTSRQIVAEEFHIPHEIINILVKKNLLGPAFKD